MDKKYRIILQIKTPDGYTFRLWDSERQIFNGLPKIGTFIAYEKVGAEEIKAKKLAEEIMRLTKCDYLVRMEEIPEKFALIEAKGF